MPTKCTKPKHTKAPALANELRRSKAMLLAIAHLCDVANPAAVDAEVLGGMAGLLRSAARSADVALQAHGA